MPGGAIHEAVFEVFGSGAATPWTDESFAKAKSRLPEFDGLAEDFFQMQLRVEVKPGQSGAKPLAPQANQQMGPGRRRYHRKIQDDLAHPLGEAL